jgi:hypothetical protein
MAKRGSRFEAGSGCYTCRACNKLTRSTGRGDNENVGLCARCYDEGGMVNEHSDNGGIHYGYEATGGKAPNDCPRCREEQAQ